MHLTAFINIPAWDLWLNLTLRGSRTPDIKPRDLDYMPLQCMYSVRGVRGVREVFSFLHPNITPLMLDYDLWGYNSLPHCSPPHYVRVKGDMNF